MVSGLCCWQAVDKRGKLFTKLDTSSTGHVTVEGFQAFFGAMKSERGEKAADQLMAHMEKYAHPCSIAPSQLLSVHAVTLLALSGT